MKLEGKSCKKKEKWKFFCSNFLLKVSGKLKILKQLVRFII